MSDMVQRHSAFEPYSQATQDRDRITTTQAKTDF
jgi:hypothetical protein